MGKTLLEIGKNIRYEEAYKYLKNIEKDFEDVIFLVQNKHKVYYEGINPKKILLFEKQHFSTKEIMSSIRRYPNELLYKIVDNIIKDPNSLLILSRTNLNRDEYYPMRIRELTIRLVNKAIHIITKADIENLIIHNTPHREDWFLFRTAEILGKNIYIFRESIIDGHSRIFKGVLNQKPLKINLDHLYKYDQKLILEHLSKFKKSRHYDILPEYSKDRLKIYNSGFTGFFSEIKFINSVKSINIKRTIKSKLAALSSSLEKQKSLNYYIKNISIKTIEDIKDKYPYVIYFMHYQPERTSIPEANDFSSQYKAVAYLRSCLPENINIIIKEHPDTYRNMFSKKFKSLESYKNLLNIKSVFFADMNLDTFELIDNSLIVSTLTGHVSLEALCRFKKVIYFGNSIYNDCTFALDATKKNFKTELKKIIEIDENRKIDEKSLINYFTKTLKSSVPNDIDNFSMKLCNFLLQKLKSKSILK